MKWQTPKKAKKKKKGTRLLFRFVIIHLSLPQANFRSLNTAIASGPGREKGGPGYRQSLFLDCPWQRKIQTTLNQNIFGELI